MKLTVISIFIASALIIGAIFIIGNNDSDSVKEENVSIVDGKQVVSITAKGGYFPRVSYAAAGVPTILKVNTQGTFDCSAALIVPAVNFRQILPSSGVTEIEIPPQDPNSTIQGICSMGMYSFQVKFN